MTAEAENIIANAPAPWSLTGDGYILLCRFSRAFAQGAGGAYPVRGAGIGAVMIVRYASTPVAPYDELLIVPGALALPGRTGYSISRIYVSTMASVVNGIANWAIPKELATFSFEAIDGHTERVRVGDPETGEPFADYTLSAGGLTFPISAAILPPLVQYRDGMTFVTRVMATGQAQFATLIQTWADGVRFPAIRKRQVLAAVKVKSFRMTFPTPHVLHD